MACHKCAISGTLSRMDSVPTPATLLDHGHGSRRAGAERPAPGGPVGRADRPVAWPGGAGATGRASGPTGLGSTSPGSVLAQDRGDDRYPAGQRTSLGSAVLGAPAVGARTAVELLDEHGTVLASAPLPAPETLPAVRPAAPPPPVTRDRKSVG